MNAPGHSDRRPLLNYGLVCLAFLGIYLGFNFYIGGNLPVPFALAGVACMALLGLNIHRLHQVPLSLPLMLIGLCFLSFYLRGLTLPAMSTGGHLRNQFQSWMILAYALIVSLGAYLELTKWSPRMLERIFHVMVVAMLIGAGLEVFTPFKEISDAVRLALFNPEIIYSNNLRDMREYGMVRPKLFTSEPSHLAKFFFLAISCWLFATERRLKYPLFYVYVFIAVALIRSPVVLAALFVPFALMLSRGDARNPNVMIFIGLMLILLVVPAAILLTQSTMMTRLENIASGEDPSAIIRLLAPFHVMLAVIADHPVLGLGYGAKEIGFGYVKEAYSIVPHKFLRQHTIETLGHNFFFNVVIQLGLLGFVLFTILVWRMIRAFAQADFIAVLLVMLALMNFTGATNSTRIWFFFFVLFAVARVVHSHRREGQPGPALRPLPGGLAPAEKAT